MNKYTLTVTLTFPISAHPEDVRWMMQHLPASLEDDLRVICAACVPEDDLRKGDVEVTVRAEPG